MLQAVVTSIQRNYRGTLYRLFLINMHWLLRGIWSLVSKLVDEFTSHKIILMGYTFKEEVLKIIDAAQLEERYGGILENKTDKYFPP